MRDSYLDAPNFTQGKEPEFYSDRSQFVVSFPNMNYGVIAEGDYSNREQDKEQDREQDVIQVGCKTLTQIIEYCKVPKSRAELQEYCGLKGRRNFGKNHLTPLLEKGVLKMTIPDKPTSKNQKYYSGPKQSNT